MNKELLRFLGEGLDALDAPNAQVSTAELERFRSFFREHFKPLSANARREDLSEQRSQEIE